MSTQPPPNRRDEREKRLELPSVPLLAGRNNIFYHLFFNTNDATKLLSVDDKESLVHWFV